VLHLPIVADLQGALAGLERAVPQELDQTGAWQMVAEGRVGLKYRVRRSPLSVALEGEGLRATFQAQVAAEGCVRLPFRLGGEDCTRVARCGGEGQPLGVEVTLRSRLGWAQGWHLQSESAPALRFLDPCLIPALGLDVTPYLERGLAPLLADATRELDARLAALTDVRPRAAALWDELQRPVALTPGVWLLLQPRAVQASAPRGEALRLGTTLGVTVQPLVLLGEQPPPPGTRPLPPLATAEAPADEALKLALDVRLPYRELTARLQRELAGTTLQVDGRAVKVREVRVEGSGGGALVFLRLSSRTGPLGLRTTEADVYLTARPRYDAAERLLVLEDLDYTVATEDALARAAEWWNRGRLRAALQERARIPVGEQLEALRGAAEGGLQRELGPGVRLSGQVQALEPQGVYTTLDAFVVRALVQGRARLEVDSAALGAVPP
jgi:hypothetical protein